MAEESKGYMPKLRFKSFQPWQHYSLEDIFEFKKNSTNSREDLSGSGNIYYIHYGDIHTKYLGFVDFTKNNIPFLKDNIPVKSDFICNGDIIIADASEDEEGIGKTVEVKNLSKEEKAISGLHTILLRPHKKIFSPFFASYLFSAEHTKKQFIKIATGIKVYSLAKSALKNVELVVPTIAEQQKIADCLSSLDELIQAHEQKRDALVEHKKGLMQRLFPAEGETTPRWRFPEFRKAAEWRKSPLGVVARFYNGRAYSQEELLERGKYRVLRVGNLFNNGQWYYSDFELEKEKYCDTNDLLYAWSASFGPFIWKGGKVIYHYHIWKVVPKSMIDKKFLYYILNIETDKIKKNMLNGLGIMHVTKSAIEKWECRFPSLPEQQKIADCLSSLDARIEAEEAKIASLREHKQGLMQRLFPQNL